MSAITQAVLSRLAQKSSFATTVFNQAHIDLLESPNLSDMSKLMVLDEAMDQAQTESSQVVSSPTLVANVSSRRAPEVGARSVIQPAEVATTGLTEVEKSAELPPEVSEYLTRVEDHAQTLPQQIVVEGNQMSLQPSHAPVTPVIVLPITPDDEDKAKGKSPAFSIAWLVEWSHKIIKMFLGKVVYKTVAEPAQS